MKWGNHFRTIWSEQVRRFNLVTVVLQTGEIWCWAINEIFCSRYLHYKQIKLQHTPVYACTHTHLFRGTGRCSARRWPPGQCPPRCAWSGRLLAGRAEPRRQAGSRPQFLGGIWSPRGSWCRWDLLPSSFCGHTERRGDVIDSGRAELLNKQNALGQRAQNCFSFINSRLSKIALQSLDLWNNGWLIRLNMFFLSAVFQDWCDKKTKNKKKRTEKLVFFLPSQGGCQWMDCCSLSV